MSNSPAPDRLMNRFSLKTKAKEAKMPKTKTKKTESKKPKSSIEADDRVVIAYLLRSPGGKDERKVDVGQLSAPAVLGGGGIPDLWHLAQSIPDLAKIAAAFKVSNHLVDEDKLRDFLDEDDPITMEGFIEAQNDIEGFEPIINTKGANAQAMILDAWHYAHDLKRRTEALATALQPIMELLVPASGHAEVTVPVELLREVLAIHTGQKV